MFGVACVCVLTQERNGVERHQRGRSERGQVEAFQQSGSLARHRRAKSPQLQESEFNPQIVQDARLR